ncbi:glycosyltransferase [Vulgatibacter incomptus]|uniref:Trehalose synthase, nucleoside diphosphate glucose dependent n=1 Tax=Vulgatibacter incomptus TaxID=1391653 RepID=A0A0K1PFI5_9BACT|nr:glycosyltransferase [Vulgatibacter incomptus]AKU91874.1 Trehalose synthase, nucleoside diphosphate glucose dependent [Vulgatibacter incomptus]
MAKEEGTCKLCTYEPIVGPAALDEIRRLAEPLRDLRLQNVSSTLVGGGVAELMARLTPLLREVGIGARWDVMTAEPAFFDVTKAFHNALHGGDEEITPESYALYLETNEKNAGLISGDADVVGVHDPQPLGLVQFRKAAPEQRWVWRCHIDISDADLRVWGFLRPFVERCDAAIFHLPQYAKELLIPQIINTPAIDPLDEKNREMPPETIRDTLEELGIDPGRPLVVQVSRFDRLKDPLGVIEAYRLVRKWLDCQLVLAGGSASDDPEGAQVLEEVRERAEGDPDIHVAELPPNAHRTINALQRGATVVVQKSLREGFGLVVTEAMWKGKPVVGTAVGGIAQQIVHGQTGFLVRTVEGTAYRVRQLLANPGLASRLGRAAHHYVRENLLITSYVKSALLMLHTLRAADGRNPIVL